MNSTIVMTNCIVWGNHAPYGPEISDWPPAITATFSDLPLSGNGNFYGDPRFVSNSKGDYYLDQAYNDCVGGGDLLYPMIDGTTSPTGELDIDEVDMGCHYPD